MAPEMLRHWQGLAPYPFDHSTLMAATHIEFD
jgi:hypothetical protein